MSEINNLERFIDKMKSGQLAVGAVITFTDPTVSELCADAGMDFLWIDGEHGVMDRTTAMLEMMAIRGTKCASLYRVPACNHTEIKRIIDFAPAGVIIPMVLTKADAELAVAACRYPLTGNRGVGLRRQLRYGADPLTADYWEKSLHEPLVIIQIEHIDAVNNLDDILSVPGIDSLLIGPYDLSTSMGKPGQFRAPEVCNALDTVCRKCRAAGKWLGAYTEGDYDLWRERGLHYVCSANDTGVLFNGIRAMKERVKKEFGRD